MWKGLERSQRYGRDKGKKRRAKGIARGRRNERKRKGGKKRNVQRDKRMYKGCE